MILNLNEVKRPTLEIVLNDKEQTHLTLKAPQKIDSDMFINMFDDLLSKEKKHTMNDVWKTCAKILSYNLENKEITPSFVESIFSIDDVIIFVSTYKDFILGIYNSKN